MTDSDDATFWQSFNKATGWRGGCATILIIMASNASGWFDWKIFFLGSLALLLAWSQSWMLVPTHLRHEDAEKKEWQRYIETDWRFVDSVSGMSGAEIDAMREIFRQGDDARARAMIDQIFAFSGDDQQEFLRFFNEQFMDTVSAYLDENGRLWPMD